MSRADQGAEFHERLVRGRRITSRLDQFLGTTPCPGVEGSFTGTPLLIAETGEDSGDVAIDDRRTLTEDDRSDRTRCVTPHPGQ